MLVGLPSTFGEEDGGRGWIEGTLTLNLVQPEAITHVKIRIKGVVRTMVLKVHGSGRHQVTDEVSIWEDSANLWHEDSGDVPSGNRTNENGKLMGVFTFTFRLHIPNKVRRPSFNPDGTTSSKSLRLPPSFVLSGDHGSPGMRGNDWASCRYFIKVTLGRKGMLKINERLILPLIYLPRQEEPIGSPGMMMALQSGSEIPGPLQDPTGWAGKKIRHPVKRGVFSAKRAFYEVVLLLPAPSRFSRLQTIPFAIKITTTDKDTTTSFPSSGVQVFLLQRCIITAQGLTATHDSIVARSKLEDDGSGPVVPGGNPDGLDWAKRFKGSIKLNSNVGSSFVAPNIVVAFFVVVHISVPGAGNDSELAVPIGVVAATRTAYPVVRTLPPSEQREEAPPVPYTSADAELGLPPSYFEVMERD